MWHIEKFWQARGAGKERFPRHHHRGFSHPARFEKLEERVALNAAPSAPNFTTGSGVGTNPANFSPTNASSSGVATEGSALDNQQVAFNTPYWLPNDRAPFTPPPSDQLPANFNQAAQTPQGVRNFNIGPDTSTHFTTPGAALTALRPTNRSTGENRFATGSLDETLLADALLGADTLVAPHEEAAATEPPNDVPMPRGYDEGAPFDGAAIADASLAAKLVVEGSVGAAHVEPAHLEAVAVDRMMAERSEADTARADAAIVQVVGEATGETEPGPGPMGHALAASVALATSVPIAGPKGATDRHPTRAEERAPAGGQKKEGAGTRCRRT